jgi:type I restriction enzyme M protein
MRFHLPYYGGHLQANYKTQLCYLSRGNSAIYYLILMPTTTAKKTKQAPKSKKLATQQSLDKQIWAICDIMRRSNASSAIQYVPELTWILFLRILDERETREQQEAEAQGIAYTPSLAAPFRWCDWAAPNGSQRTALTEGALGAFFGFVNGKPNNNGELEGLLPYLKGLKNKPAATARQKVISEVMSGVKQVGIDTEKNFLDVIDKVHLISSETIDPTHIFTLSQVYEGLLLKMGEKSNDGGQYFTPREVIRAVVQVVNPQIDKTIYDPCCGTGGFLASSYQYICDHLGDNVTAEQMQALKERTFWGREKENLAYPIALANLILHGIDKPNVWHGNTLTGSEVYGGLFENAPAQFDYILTNPPFGGKEGKEAQTNFDYKTNATQTLFVQHIIRSLKNGGTCGMVLDEGLLFRTDSDAFVAAGGAVKTDLLFFTKGKPTQKIWYYDLSDIKVRKKQPMTLKMFDGFFAALATRADSELSWTVDMDARKAKADADAKPLFAEASNNDVQSQQLKQKINELKKITPKDHNSIETLENEIKALSKSTRDLTSKANEVLNAVYDLKAVNPNKKGAIDDRTPEQLLQTIADYGREIQAALALLKSSNP